MLFFLYAITGTPDNAALEVRILLKGNYKCNMQGFGISITGATFSATAPPPQPPTGFGGGGGEVGLGQRFYCATFHYLLLPQV